MREVERYLIIRHENDWPNNDESLSIYGLCETLQEAYDISCQLDTNRFIKYKIFKVTEIAN